MLTVLDTTVLIDYLRGRPAVNRVLGLRASGDVAATTAINVEEVVRGIRPGETERVGQLFEGLVVLPISAAAAWRAGVWRREFAGRGITLWQPDCLIAGATAEAGAVLATGNPEDFPMDGLVVQTWAVGE